MINYRNLRQEEAKEFWNMMNGLDCETKFMLYEPGERERIAYDIQPVKHMIESSLNGKNFLLIADAGQGIAGYILAQRGMLNRIKHSAYVVIGIRDGYRGNGIGTELFTRLNLWAEANGITRLELTVMCTNQAAKHLYEKSGFAVEGIKRNSMFVDGEYVDEYYMAKLL